MTLAMIGMMTTIQSKENKSKTGHVMWPQTAEEEMNQTKELKSCKENFDRIKIYTVSALFRPS